MKDRLVAVVWRDPRVDQADTYTREEIAVRALPYFTTFGLLARDDEQVVAVAAEQGEDGAFRGVTYILRPLVKEIVPICLWPKKPRGGRPREKKKEPKTAAATVPGLGDIDRID
jgi:hypothetical protein